jgi:alcohol dehydrogenase (NADP+)
VTRQELWITSKLWNNAHLPDLVFPALEQTLNDLQIEYIDLYLMHWPVALRPDIIFPAKGDEFMSLTDIPLIDTWRALEKPQRQGLCRHIGVSNFNIPKIKALMQHGGTKPECNQVESHPILAQNKLLSFCKEQHIAYTAYSPLGSLDRPARVRKSNDPNLLENPVITQIANELSSTPGQLLIAWAMQRGTAVIPKSSNPGRLRQNFEAVEITLSTDQMQKIGALDRNHRFIDGSIWTIEGSPYTLEDLWNL